MDSKLFLALALLLTAVPSLAQEPRAEQLPDAPTPNDGKAPQSAFDARYTPYVPNSIQFEWSKCFMSPKVFGADTHASLMTFGATHYHTFEDFRHGQIQVQYGYGGEVVLLTEPRYQNKYTGAPLGQTTGTKTVPGVGAMPVDFRFLMGSEGAIGVRTNIDVFASNDVLGPAETRTDYGFTAYVQWRLGLGRKRDKGRSDAPHANEANVGIDTRHLSNGNTGTYNPGMDCQSLRVGFEHFMAEKKAQTSQAPVPVAVTEVAPTGDEPPPAD